MGFTVNYFFAMGFAQWLPTYFMRSYGLDAAQVGVWFALVAGGGGIIGAYLSVYLTGRYAARKEGLQMRCMAAAFVIAGCSYVMMFLSNTFSHVIIFLTIPIVLGGMMNGPTFSAIQSLVGEQMRSVTLALIFLIANFVGLGLGPVASGALSDLLEPALGQESLRYALLMIAPGLGWVAYYFWKAGKTIEADIKAIELAKNTYSDVAAADTSNSPIIDQSNLELKQS